MGRYPRSGRKPVLSPGKTPQSMMSALTSREAAGELLGVSWSSLADYERGLCQGPGGCGVPDG